MPINLSAPLAWTKASSDELKLLQNLQGNILKGHGREFTANIFFRFDPAARRVSKRLLRELANFHVTSSYKQLLDTQVFKKTKKGGGPFCHVALTFSGYSALGLAASAPTDGDFQAGMKSPASVSALLDPAVSQWEAPFQQEIHGLILAAHETEGQTAALSADLTKLLLEANAVVVHIQHGKALKNAAGVGIENFGYVDGRSQPLMLQEDIEDEGKQTGTSRWDPAFPLSTALVKDPGTPDANSFGSFFIFRKLEQAVRGFKAREQDIADDLGLTGAARELAGALIVGRFEDGTPVTLDSDGRGETPVNNFNYTGDAGARCPFHAHVRKVNPRGTGGAEPEPAERAHLMARRGIPFEDVKRAVHPSELPDSDSHAEFNAKVSPLLPTAGVGLLFMAYNRQIASQFKFTQQTWADNRNFPVIPAGPHGIDPVIGQGSNTLGDQKYSKVWDDPTSPVVHNKQFGGFVTMRGGEYFFSPSITFLQSV